MTKPSRAAGARVRETWGYRLSVRAIAAIVWLLGAEVVVFFLAANDVVGFGWFAALWFALGLAIVLCGVGVCAQIVAATRMRINMTDPAYVRDILSHTKRDLLSAILLGRGPTYARPSERVE
jgi:ABC-type nickel/cobalt efflux system permease component RcnA